MHWLLVLRIAAAKFKTSEITAPRLAIVFPKEDSVQLLPKSHACIMHCECGGRVESCGTSTAQSTTPSFPKTMQIIYTNVMVDYKATKGIFFFFF